MYDDDKYEKNITLFDFWNCRLYEKSLSYCKRDVDCYCQIKFLLTRFKKKQYLLVCKYNFLISFEKFVIKIQDSTIIISSMCYH